MQPLDSLPTWILSSASARVHQVLTSGLAREGITGYEYRCLSALAGADQLSQTQLGEAAALDPRDVTHTVRALQDRGLVSRAKDPGHGRRVLVSLTAAGRQVAERLTATMTDIQNEAFGNLTGGELTELLRLLRSVAPRK